MSLTTEIIKTRLASVSDNLKDNEAQNIINGATSSELKNLDAEGVLRLYEALALLAPRIFSNNDAAAMKRLAANTQYQPVTTTPDFGIDLIKTAMKSASVQLLLTSGLITRIYAAEKKRMNWIEQLGFDWSTMGRGQLGQPAYIDVKNSTTIKTAWEMCLTRVFLARLLSQCSVVFPPADASGFDIKTYKAIVPENYSDIYQEPVFEDFVVAAYIAIRIEAAFKTGRTSTDIARFAVALYHGMRPMVFNAQTIVKDEINWQPVEAELLKQGHTDEVAYVNEVVK